MSQAPIIRVTGDGSQRVTAAIAEGGVVRITGFQDVPEFDVDAAIHAHFPGIVVQQNLVEAVTIWLSQYGAVSDTDEAAILALANVLLLAKPVAPVLPSTQKDYAAVPYPAGLLRFPNSNPTPSGWSIVNDEPVVSGLEP